MRPSALQILILVLVVVLLFGASRLPDLARSVGQSLKIFKNEVKDLRDDDRDRPAARDDAPRQVDRHQAGLTDPRDDLRDDPARAAGRGEDDTRPRA